MAAPTISSRTPAASETNVSLNKVISITFSEALLTSTVNASNFLLRHQASKTQVKVAISLDTTGTIVTLLPDTLLWKNSTFEVIVIGLSSGLATGNLKAADSSDFATTTTWSFQTGDDIDAGNDKSETVEEREGDLFLPPGLELTDAASFQLLKTKPIDGSWGFSGNSIKLTFNREVYSGEVASKVTLYQRPFLDEDGWQAATGSYGGYLFAWESGSASGTYTAAHWDFPTWTVTGNATGTVMYLSTTGQTLANTLFEIYVDDTMTDTSGNVIESDYQVIFTSHSYPDTITPRTIRNEMFSVFDTLNLEFVHQVVWKWMIDAYRIGGFLRTRIDSNGPYLRRYVICGAVMDIMESIWAEKALMAGVTKTLGDFTVSYHPSAGDLSKNGVYKKSMDCLEKAKRAIRNHGIQWFVKGWNSNEPINYRMRLWKNPRVSLNYDGRPRPSSYPVANTIDQRDAKLPGADNSWS